MTLGRGRALKSQHAMSNTSMRGDVQGDWRQIRSFVGARGAKVRLSCQNRRQCATNFKIPELGTASFVLFSLVRSVSRPRHDVNSLAVIGY